MTARRRRGATQRSAFTLIEMLVVMFGLGVAMAVGTALILTGIRINHTGDATHTRLTRRMEVTRLFRSDVARAESAPDRFGEWQAGPTCLVLAMPGGSHVAYQWAEDGLVRVERTGDAETRRPLPVGVGGDRVEFVRGAGIVTLRLHEAAAAGPQVRTELTVALGGDRR